MQKLTFRCKGTVKIFVVIAFLLPAKKTFSQELSSLTLDLANELAQKNYPLIRQKDLVRQTAGINIDNLNKRYLPQFSLSAQASYQSDVTGIDVQLPGFKLEPPGKDQYRLLADISQMVYDGGTVKYQKEMQQLNAAVEDQKVSVDMYKLRERVNQLFLGLLYLHEQLKQVDLIKDDLQTGLKRVEAQVANGVAFKSNVNLLKAEVLKTNQRAIELDASRKGMQSVLGLFLDTTLSKDLVLQQPLMRPAIPGKDEGRPEFKLFTSQGKLLDQQIKVIKAANQPKASLFLQGGYGRPSLNLLKNQFDFFYIGGVRLNWSLGGLYTSKKENYLVALSKKSVDIQKETFALNMKTQLEQQQSEIDKLEQLTLSDIEIIALREQVKTASKAQLENGVITASDYLREVNAEDQARQSLILHQVQLLQARIEYNTISGKP